MSARFRVLRRLRRASAGFALIEVLLALSLLSVGIVTVLGSLQNSLGAVEDTRLYARAQLLSEEMFASWRLEVPEVGTTHGRSKDGRFQWSLRIEGWSPEWETLDDDAEATSHFQDGLRIATLSVEWVDGLRRRSIERQEILLVDVVD